MTKEEREKINISRQATYANQAVKILRKYDEKHAIELTKYILAIRFDLKQRSYKKPVYETVDLTKDQWTKTIIEEKFKEAMKLIGDITPDNFKKNILCNKEIERFKKASKLLREVGALYYKAYN